MSNVQSANQSPLLLRSLSANPTLSSKEVDGQKTDTGDKYPKNLTELLTMYPDFCRGRLLAISNYLKKNLFTDLPIIYTKKGPVWVNRKRRRDL